MKAGSSSPDLDSSRSSGWLAWRGGLGAVRSWHVCVNATDSSILHFSRRSGLFPLSHKTLSLISTGAYFACAELWVSMLADLDSAGRDPLFHTSACVWR